MQQWRCPGYKRSCIAHCCFYSEAGIKKIVPIVVLVLMIISVGVVVWSLVLRSKPSIPDTGLSRTFWLSESMYREGLAKYTGMAFIDGKNAQIIFFDEFNRMHIEKGEYELIDDAFGSFYYDSKHYYEARFQEVWEYNQLESDFLFTESDMKEALFREGGMELLFRLRDTELEVFGGFTHERDIGINLINFWHVTLAELQEIFTDYRIN